MFRSGEDVSQWAGRKAAANQDPPARRAEVHGTLLNRGPDEKPGTRLGIRQDWGRA